MSRVLIVDDEQSIAELTQQVLRFEGYSAQIAYTVAEALNAVEGQRPDVVLCDWSLPDGTAQDVIDQLDSIPIIIMSGSMPADVVLKRVAGHLLKPCSTVSLLATLRHVLSTI